MRDGSPSCLVGHFGSLVKSRLSLAYTCIYSHKKSTIKRCFPCIINANSNFYEPVLNVPTVLATAVPIPVPCGVCIQLSYLTDIVIVAGSDVAYASVL